MNKKNKGNWDKNQFKKSNGKRGNKKTWSNAANTLLKKQGDKNEYLDLLGLSDIPNSIAELKRVYHKKMLDVHPDKGGSEHQAKMVIEAYNNIKELIE